MVKRAKKGMTVFARFAFTIVSSHYLLVNCGTGEEGLTFQRDFHLLVF